MSIWSPKLAKLERLIGATLYNTFQALQMPNFVYLASVCAEAHKMAKKGSAKGVKITKSTIFN